MICYNLNITILTRNIELSKFKKEDYILYILYLINVIVGILIVITGIINLFNSIKEQNRVRGFLIYYSIIERTKCLKIQLYGSILASIVVFFSGIIKVIYPENNLLFFIMLLIYIFITHGITLVCKFKGYIKE